MNGSAVLVQLDTNRIYELNATGARIWSLLEQGLDRRGITSHLCEEFAASTTDVEQEVNDLLAQLTSEELIGA